MTLKTPQTGPEGRVVKQLLVEESESVEIGKEMYLGSVADRNSQRVALMASSEGGMDIEEVAARTPEKIHKLFIDPDTGLRIADADGIARSIGISERSVVQARVFGQNLYQAFDGSDASLAEINPLVLTRDGRVIAFDTKFDFDEEDPVEVEASKFDLSYIALVIPDYLRSTD